MSENKTSTIEILSPGKNLFYAKEAIKCGADAIYIGAPKFSLRHEQANSMEDIKNLVEYAHRYWAKVYIPLNCLLYTEEDTKLALDMINEFYNIGVDGIIIQDIGILELDLPPIPVILSTNAMCYTDEDAKFFAKCNVDRIVFPRELTFEEMKSMAESANIKFEAFCYGFLCVGYSGNCYLAYVENLHKSKSSDIAHYQASNHGVCPERCMGHWTLKDANGNIIRENDRLLNLRFLALSESEIEKLFDAGIDSFKIAGREKDLKHVKNSTAYYSAIANKLVKSKGIKRASSGRTILSFEPDLYKNFNKGYTNFFFNGRKKEMYSNYDLVGEFISEVVDYNKVTKSFKINAEKELNVGDKLRYQIGKDEVKTIQITDVKDGRYYTNDISDDLTGAYLYRYINKKGFDEVENSVNYRVISVKISVVNADGVYNITARDEDDNSVELKIQLGNKEVSFADFSYPLNEDCEFIVDELSGDCLKIDEADNLREQIFNALRSERAKNRPIHLHKAEKTSYPFYKKKLTYLNNVSNKCTECFYKRHGVEEIEPGLETDKNISGKRVFTARYCLRNELGLCSKNNPDNLPPLPWQLEQIESGEKYEVHFDCKKCQMFFLSKSLE